MRQLLTSITSKLRHHPVRFILIFTEIRGIALATSLATPAVGTEVRHGTLFSAEKSQKQNATYWPVPGEVITEPDRH